MDIKEYRTIEERIEPEPVKTKEEEPSKPHQPIPQPFQPFYYIIQQPPPLFYIQPIIQYIPVPFNYLLPRLF
jgi:hypothetical protein